MKKEIILASSSPRRRELMRMAGLDFTVEVPDVPEIVPPSLPKEKESQFLAEMKATVVSVRHPKEIVIGSDTTVICEGRVLGKPKSEQEARDMLHFLSGRTHEVYTGVSIICGDEADAESFTSVTSVEFYELSDAEIEAYIRSGEPMDKAGAYGIQGPGCRFVLRIEGDYFTVVGFPIAEVIRRLERLAEEYGFSYT